jgi:hypothetical protein
VCARENGDADDAPVAAPAIVRQRVARWRREQDATARRRVDDEDARQERLGARMREEENEAEVDVLGGEAAGSARGEVEGEARGGGVELDKDGRVMGLVRRRLGGSLEGFLGWKK